MAKQTTTTIKQAKEANDKPKLTWKGHEKKEILTGKWAFPSPPKCHHLQANGAWIN